MSKQFQESSLDVNSTQRANKSGIPQKKRYKFWLFPLLVVAMIAAFCLAGIYVDYANQPKRYERFLENPDKVCYPDLAFRDTFTRWNMDCIGNDVNVLLAGGAMYARAEISILPNAEQNGYEISRNKEVCASIDSRISYINVAGDHVYYRDDQTRNLYDYDIAQDKIVCISTENVGEVFLTNQKLYYISYDENASLVCVSLNGENREIVISEPILCFAVCGDTVLYLNTSQQLCLFQSSKRQIASHIERFVLNGMIIAESGNTVLQFGPMGNKATRIIDLPDDDAHLIGVTGESLLFQEDGKLLCAPISKAISGERTKLFDGPCALYGPVLQTSDGHLLVGAYKYEENGASFRTILKLR